MRAALLRGPWPVILSDSLVTHVNPKYMSMGPIALDSKKDPIRMAETFVF